MAGEKITATEFAAQLKITVEALLEHFKSANMRVKDADQLVSPAQQQKLTHFLEEQAAAKKPAATKEPAEAKLGSEERLRRVLLVRVVHEQAARGDRAHGHGELAEKTGPGAGEVAGQPFAKRLRRARVETGYLRKDPQVQQTEAGGGDRACQPRAETHPVQAGHLSAGVGQHRHVRAIHKIRRAWQHAVRRRVLGEHGVHSSGGHSDREHGDGRECVHLHAVQRARHEAARCQARRCGDDGRVVGIPQRCH